MKRAHKYPGRQFLIALFLLVLALPAWGATLAKKTDTFGNMALVSPSDKNLLLTLANIATFTSPVTAMARIATWCGTPSETNPCLIKILPGVYDLAGGSLTMKPFVDIEGSGESTTFITSAYSDATLSGVVNGADHAELRLLTVKNTSTASSPAVAIANKSQSPKITHVTAIASGAITTYALYNSGAAPILNNVTVSASVAQTCNGVYNTASSPTLNDVTVSAVCSFESFGIHNLDSSAPTLNNVTIKTDGHFSNGVYNSDSSPVMRSVTVTTTGLNSYAMTNTKSAPVLSNVLITARPGTNGHGIENVDSALTMNDVTITIGPTFLSAFTSTSSSPVTIMADRCTFVGAVSNSGSSIMKIGGSRIFGGVAGDGVTCVGSYNGDFVALGTNCK